VRGATPDDDTQRDDRVEALAGQGLGGHGKLEAARDAHDHGRLHVGLIESAMSALEQSGH